MPSTNISDYERIRAENVLERNKKFHDLGIEDAKMAASSHIYFDSD